MSRGCTKISAKDWGIYKLNIAYEKTIGGNIRKIREPEPYKGKGIKYKGEFILRKEGKRAGKK